MNNNIHCREKLAHFLNSSTQIYNGNYIYVNCKNECYMRIEKQLVECLVHWLSGLVHWLSGPVLVEWSGTLVKWSGTLVECLVH